MDFYRTGSKKSIWSLIDEEQRNLQCPNSPRSVRSTTQQKLFENEMGQMGLSPGRTSSASVASMAPSSPGSPWALSPLRGSTTPSLLYHCLASLHRLDGNVYSIAIAKGVVFTGSASRSVRIWRQPECLERGHLKTSSGNVCCILAEDDMLFTTHKDRKIRAWSFTVKEQVECKKVTTLPSGGGILSLYLQRGGKRWQHKDTISCLAYYRAEGLLYSGSWDRTVKAWSLADKRCMDSFVAHESHVNAMAISQEDGCLFTASSDGSVKVWKRVYGQTTHALTVTLRFQPSPVNALALSSYLDSSFLYSGSSDGVINFWEKDPIFGMYHHGGFLTGHRLAVLCLATVEKLVLSGSEDTTIRVWSREEGSNFHACITVLEGHRGPVKCLAASMEMEKEKGLLVYSASVDRTVKVWRIRVFSEEKESMDDVERNDQTKKKMMGYERCPVLSPSWVERKLHGIQS